MVWAPALVLMTVASSAATPARPLASTYDEAACPPLADAAPTPDDPIDLAPGSCSSEPVAVVPPAMVDCNDPGMSAWVQEMIGSCDMPKPAPPTQGVPTVVRGTRTSPTNRVCDGLHCSHDADPLHSAPRSDEDGAPMILSAIAVAWWPSVGALPPIEHALRDQTHRSPLERPPRG